MKTVTLFEVAISIFAGYCCMYFITDKAVGLTPAKFLEGFFETLSKKIKKDIERWNKL